MELRLIKFLRKPRITSIDKEKVLKSFWIWNQDATKEPDEYHLSLLGILNTILNKVFKRRLAIVISSGRQGQRIKLIK